MADKVHLTWQATNRLAKHLKLNTQGDCISKWKTKRGSQSTRHADSRKNDTYAHTSNNQTSGNQTSRQRSANYRSRDQGQSTRQNQHHHTNSRHHNNRSPQTSTTQNGNEWQQWEQQKNETDCWCTFCRVYGHNSRQCRGYYWCSLEENVSHIIGASDGMNNRYTVLHDQNTMTNKADHADDYAHNKPKTIKKNMS